MNYMILFFILNHINILPAILILTTLFFVVLYQLDQVQVSNFNLLALPQLLPIIFTFVDFQDYGTHSQL